MTDENTQNNSKIVEPISTEAQGLDIKNDNLADQYSKLITDAQNANEKKEGELPTNTEPDAQKTEQGKEGAAEGEKEKGNDIDKKEPGFKKKFRLKIERFSRLIADGEKFAYEKLNAPYKDEYGEETKEDFDEIIENRLTLMSEYGDVLNLMFDLVGHAVDSGLEARRKTSTITTNKKIDSKWF